MIRTHIIPCALPRSIADALNRDSGRIYTGVLVTHWRVVRKQHLWLSQKSGTRLSDWRTTVPMHAHTIDAAQQGFYNACATTRALHKAGRLEAKFPHRPKRFRTTIWKYTTIKRDCDTLTLSNGKGNAKIVVRLPTSLGDVVRVLEVRLVYDKKAQRYAWHVVAENGKQPKAVPGTNVVSVDLGEIHPAVVGDEQEAVIITCRERRHEMQGHAKRLAKLSHALSRKRKGSRRYKRLLRAKSRMKAKHARVLRDMEHKISRAIVDVAVARKASTIVVGDVCNIADGVILSKQTNQKISSWNHGKVCAFITYKAAAEGITVQLVDERYTSQTCPACRHRHKPRGRLYTCPACRFQSHRDVVGQVNILSVFKYRELATIQAPTTIKHRMPHNLRLMRRCQDTGQVARPVAWGTAVQRSLFPQEAARL